MNLLEDNISHTELLKLDLILIEEDGSYTLTPKGDGYLVGSQGLTSIENPFVIETKNWMDFLEGYYLALNEE